MSTGRLVASQSVNGQLAGSRSRRCAFCGTAMISLVPHPARTMPGQGGSPTGNHLSVLRSFHANFAESAPQMCRHRWHKGVLLPRNGCHRNTLTRRILGRNENLKELRSRVKHDH